MQYSIIVTQAELQYIVQKMLQCPFGEVHDIMYKIKDAKPVTEESPKDEPGPAPD
jgi:hypothetical protein